MSKKPKILIVDDEPLNAKLLVATLMDESYDIVLAEDGEACLEKLTHESFDLILLDVMMPGQDGWEICRQINKNPVTKDIPILFITALTEAEHKCKGFEAGAVDYITKPFDNLEVKARVQTHLALKDAQDGLKNQNLILDKKVKERTAALEESNIDLQREIVAKQTAYDELRVSEAKNRAMLKAMPDEVIHFDKNGTILGYTGKPGPNSTNPNPAKGSKIDQLFPEEIANEAMRYISTALQSGEIEICEYQLPSDNGLRDYEFRIVKTAEEEVLAISRDITDKKRTEQALQDENQRLKASIKDRFRLGDIIGKSQLMQHVYDRILEAAKTDAGVIIYGESGTGKELVARAVHDMSTRRDKAFVPVNSGAIPENLLESEFFGYKKGAFTGASSDKHGYLDLAQGGTLFLDEIGDIGLSMQIKLLRAIDGGGYTPVGGNQVKNTDVRIIAATNKNLAELVKKGEIREDFYYRIHIIPINMPPLRERKEDLPLLIDHFLKIYGNSSQKNPPITGKILDALTGYDWPGNVRELQNSLQRYVTLKKFDFLELPSSEMTLSDDTVTEDAISEVLNYQAAVEKFEKKLILHALERHQWHREKAAASLGIPRRTFFRKLKSLELIQA